MSSLLTENDLNSLFVGSSTHPLILKMYLVVIYRETLVICDKILEYRNDFDAKLTDPVNLVLK